MKRFFMFFGGALALVCFIGIGTFMSCSTEDSIHADSEPPVFLECKAVSSRELTFTFSHAVKVVTLNFEPALEVESTGNGETVTVILKEALNEGDSITADLLVEDDAKHTLNVLVPFRARNDRIPKLLITELRTEYTKSKATEFVEFKTLEAGNLGAIRLFIPGNTKNPLAFEFPTAEVVAGEYILVHLRTTDADTGAANETGKDLGLSGGIDARDSARDFWVPGTDKLLHKTDIVYLTDQDDKILDAVMMSENADAAWSKEAFTTAAEFLHQQGAWVSAGGGVPGPKDAVITANIKTSLTRSVSRDEAAADANNAANWYITATSNATPGEPNSTKRFE
ncbi:hypothetical protein FACS1894109_09160 [Spirochaetia bacterium]|nr:hypothetical protein FACS1894109_09160 [Spirochaetia bacterium]